MSQPITLDSLKQRSAFFRRLYALAHPSEAQMEWLFADHTEESLGLPSRE